MEQLQEMREVVHARQRLRMVLSQLLLPPRQGSTVHRLRLLVLSLILQHSREYCYRLRERLRDTWVLWVHASNAARFDESMWKLTDDLKIFGLENAKRNIFQLVYDWLRNSRKGKWVLVLDNADDARFLFEPVETDDAT
jgi:hypothetical protein